MYAVNVHQWALSMGCLAIDFLGRYRNNCVTLPSGMRIAGRSAIGGKIDHLGANSGLSLILQHNHRS